MKKTISIFCVIIFLLLCSFAAFAEKNDNILSFYCKSCPSKIVDYATQNYAKFVNSACEANIIECNSIIELGSPFMIFDFQNDNDIFLFPVICDDKVLGTFRVYEDCNTSEDSQVTYSAVFSVFLADELNQLMTNGASGPFLLYYGSDGIYVYENNKSDKLLNYTGRISNEQLNYESAFIDNKLHKLCVSQINNYLSIADLALYSQINGTRYTHYIALSITETQPNGYSWCGAYATAAILRTLSGNSTTPTASSLMNMFYGSPSPSDRFYNSYAVTAGNIYGYSPTYITSTLSINNTYTEINANRPIYLYCSAYFPPSLFDYHAIVMTGYSSTASSYTVWNPWHSYQEIMSSSTNNYYDSAENCYLAWQQTVYGW